MSEVRIEHTRLAMVDQVRAANTDVLTFLMEEGVLGIEEEIRARGLTQTGSLMVRVVVEGFCE